MTEPTEDERRADARKAWRLFVISAIPTAIVGLIIAVVFASRSDWGIVALVAGGVFGPLALLLPWFLRVRRFGQGESID
jgi:hypothetical protein